MERFVLTVTSPREILLQQLNLCSGLRAILETSALCGLTYISQDRSLKDRKTPAIIESMLRHPCGLRQPGTLQVNIKLPDSREYLRSRQRVQWHLSLFVKVKPVKRLPACSWSHFRASWQTCRDLFTFDVVRSTHVRSILQKHLSLLAKRSILSKLSPSYYSQETSHQFSGLYDRPSEFLLSWTLHITRTDARSGNNTCL